MKFRSWLIVLGYTILAVVAFVAFGAVAIKLVGLAGWIGVGIVTGAVLLNGVITIFEDDQPGGFNNPP